MLQPQKPFPVCLENILRPQFHEVSNVGWNTLVIILVASVRLQTNHRCLGQLH
jgi:hypothetical protein